MRLKDKGRIANSVDPDQTALWSGSLLFALTCLYEDLDCHGIYFIHSIQWKRY